jgi:hypothetical protein
MFCSYILSPKHLKPFHYSFTARIILVIKNKGFTNLPD